MIDQLEDTVHDTLDFASREGRSLVRNVGWVSAGVTVLALGVVIGTQLRSRYKFQRRTPYDFYAHSGDHRDDMEAGVGI